MAHLAYGVFLVVVGTFASDYFTHNYPLSGSLSRYKKISRNYKEICIGITTRDLQGYMVQRPEKNKEV